MLDDEAIAHLHAIKATADTNRISQKIMDRNHKGDTAEFMAISTRQSTEIMIGHIPVDVSYTHEQYLVGRRPVWMKHLTVCSTHQPNVDPPRHWVEEIMRVIGFERALADVRSFIMPLGEHRAMAVIDHL